MSIEDQIEQDLKQTFGDKGANTLRDTLAEVDGRWSAATTETSASQSREAKVRRMTFRRVLSIAASFLVLAVAGWWVVGAGQSAEPHALYAVYAEAYNVSLTVRGTNDAEGFHQAQMAYQKGDYATAFKEFQALAQQDSGAAQYTFYAGVSALLNEEAALAIPLFKNLLAQPNHLFVEQARWYLALAYLQEGDAAFAKTYLSEIKTGAFKAEEAVDILESLD